MSNKQQVSKSQELKSLDKVNKSKTNVIYGSIIATIIALTPLLFNAYVSVPDQKIWNTYFFTYNSEYYQSAFVMAWTLMSKLIPLLLMFIWIFTCRHWRYHAILITIGMFIPSIYLIRARIFNRINSVNKSTQELEDELTFRPKSLWGKIKQYF